MENFIIDTQSLDDIDFELLDVTNSVYCTNCGYCGEFGCGCWGKCTALYCKYGDRLIENYEELRRNVDKFYDMLDSLGIDAYLIDIERVNHIGKKYLPNHPFTIKRLISIWFNHLKDK